MSFSAFPEILWNCTNPENGTIRWSTACQAAKDHSCWDDFRKDYGTIPFRVDTGEFLVWLGYGPLPPDALQFSQFNRHRSMTTTTTDFYIKRTFADFFGKVDHVDFIGPYMESQEFAVKMQEGADRRRMKPAKVQITRWEWVQGKDD